MHTEITLLMCESCFDLIIEDESQEVSGLSCCSVCVANMEVVMVSGRIGCDISNDLGADNRYSICQLKVHTGNIDNYENTWIARL
jgi:hypothetical protein